MDKVGFMFNDFIKKIKTYFVNFWKIIFIFKNNFLFMIERKKQSPT